MNKIIEKKCVVCGGTYECRSLPGCTHGARSKSYRAYNSVTCTTRCSKRHQINLRRLNHYQARMKRLKKEGVINGKQIN